MKNDNLADASVPQNSPLKVLDYEKGGVFISRNRRALNITYSKVFRDAYPLSLLHLESESTHLKIKRNFNNEETKCSRCNHF